MDEALKISNLALNAFETMHVIREFEESLADMFNSGSIMGTAHFCTGQEAVAAGACLALNQDDFVTSTHRGHGHFIAKGGSLTRIFAEIIGKEIGYSKGRGGSQHMADLSCGFLGSNGITGGGIPIAIGAGFTSKYRNDGKVTLCFFGDGASNQGTFHESLNMAAIWKLPVIFLCENNHYAMSTSFTRAIATPTIAERAPAYGIPGEKIDGNDFFAVYQTVCEAVDNARNGNGPTLIEAVTYRKSGHSKSDRCEYRSREEEAYWETKDPIVFLANWLETQPELSGLAQQISNKAKAIVQEAKIAALAAAEPSTQHADSGVLAGTK